MKPAPSNAYDRVLTRVFEQLWTPGLQASTFRAMSGHRSKGTVEIDELYVGVDKDGRGYVLPVEGREESESLGIGKAVSLTLFARAKYPALICRPIAIIREGLDQIACVEFEPSTDVEKVSILDMRRYVLVRNPPPGMIARPPEPSMHP